MNSIIKIFETVRDMPYRIPLNLKEADFCCSGKHKILKDLFIEQGLEIRYRVCSFSWSSINLPEKVRNISHGDYSTYVYLEVLIDGKWIVVDATWDKEIEDVLHVNEWDGKTDTKIAVNPLEIFSLDKSEGIMNGESDEKILNDLKINGKFYEAFNNWLEEVRISKNNQ